MNSDVFYRRHTMPPKPRPVDVPPAEVSPLAVHGDPSQARRPERERAAESVRWVRFSELPTMVGNRYIRRVVDTNAAAVRQARRLPERAIARARTAGRQLRPNRTVERDGGIGL